MHRGLVYLNKLNNYRKECMSDGSSKDNRVGKTSRYVGFHYPVAKKVHVLGE